MVDMAFLSNFVEFWQLSFGLSIKITHEIENLQSLTDLSGANIGIHSEKNQTFVALNAKWLFLLVGFYIRSIYYD